MLRLLLLSLATAPLTVASSLTCVDARGIPVLVQEAQIPDLGRASLDQTGKPIIVLAPLLRKLPPVVADFILYHECGHHALGHLIGVGAPPANEEAADCWAARSMVMAGELKPIELKKVSDSISRLNHCKLNADAVQEEWCPANLGVCLSGLSAASASFEESDLGRFFEWPMIRSPKAGTYFILRTRLRNDVLQYVATVTDNKGQTEKYFAANKSRPTAQPFQITLSTASGTPLCSIAIPDSMFLKIGRTAYFEAVGESPCREEDYRVALEAVRATGPSDRSSHSWIVPPDLR
ncbi:MAG: hypothetical protein WBY44_00360 [Bryobacteraceae bacterium]